MIAKNLKTTKSKTQKVSKTVLGKRKFSETAISPNAITDASSASATSEKSIE